MAIGRRTVCYRRCCDLESDFPAMRLDRLSRLAIAIASLAAAAAPVVAQPLTVDEFRRELVGVPLCGTPDSGPLAGKALCTVHLPDGTAILAGAGLVVYGLWEADGGRSEERRVGKEWRSRWAPCQ